jgi:outer membrane protein OmpA-like peptidoglycan-associated protein
MSQRRPWLVRRLPLRGLLAPALAGAAAITTFASTASAQQRGFTADRLIIAPNPDDLFATFRPHVAERTRFFFDGYADYIRRPIKTRYITNEGRQQSDQPAVVNNQANLYLSAGAELIGRLSLSATLPITFVNTATGDLIRKTQGVNLDSFAVGDLRFDARGILAQNDAKSLRFGLAGTVFFSTGNEKSFAGDGFGHALLQALGEQKAGPVVIVQNLGVHFRNRHDLGNDTGRLSFANEMTFGVGAFVPFRSGRARIGGQIYGSTGISKVDNLGNTEKKSTFFTNQHTPVEWLGEVRFALDQNQRWWFNGGGGTLIKPAYNTPDFRVIAGIGYQFSIKDTAPYSPPSRMIKDDERISDQAPDRDGDGFPDVIDACPDVPEDHQQPNPSDGCPAPSDRDKDGIPDDKDKCPDVPEDRDGIDDEDGCPEDDVDKDGIPDAEDACPREPGKKSPDPKQNGCPQFIRRIEGSNEIAILKKIEFDTGKASIKAGSLPILDEVADLLKANPSIKKVSVEGHTDSRGKKEMNMVLSRDRAEACVKYLVTKGVEASRLASQGFGPDKPIDTNDTNDGRQKNRRTEFHIIDQ